MAKKRFLAFPILALWISILACNLVSSVQNLVEEGTAIVPISTAQNGDNANDILSALATQTAQFVQPSSTPNLPTPSPPRTMTSTPITATATDMVFVQTPVPPTQTPGMRVNKISFRKGGTSAYVQEPISHRIQHHYSVRAMGGQTLILTVSSPNNDVYLGVRGIQDGQQLLWPSAQTSYWFGTLPETQDYQITLTTQNPDTYYFLSVEIPANIYFQPGTYSATIDGFIDVDGYFHPDVMTRIRYLAHAFASQTMEVTLSSPDLSNLSLGIVGQQDGQVYIRYQVKNSGGKVDLPISQGYYLDVYSTDGKSTTFTLEIAIK
jgi:hypothetical protein